MKQIITALTFLFLISVSITHAQDCLAGTTKRDFITNRASLTHNTLGSLWGLDGIKLNDPSLSDQTIGLTSVSGIWLSGIDGAGNLKVSTQTFGSNQITDFWPGPLNNEGNTTATPCENFDQIWEIKYTDIDPFEADFLDNGIIDNAIPDAIKAWPGRGNVFSETVNGFVLPLNKNLAPFIDRDDDNIYDPSKGDMPDIKGAGLAHWWIINDNGNIHTHSNGEALGVEVAVLAYSFDDQNGSGITNIYYECQILNRSGGQIEDLKVGLWNQSALGCSDYNLIGSSPDNGLGFVYNNEPDSLSSCDPFVNGSPLYGIKLLEGVKDIDGIDLGMTAFTYMHRPGFGGPWPPQTTDAFVAEDYNNYLSAKWRDGIPFTFGGTGYNPGSIDIDPFAYSGNPSDPNDWSLCSSGLEPADRRFLLTSGGAALESNEKVKVSFALIITDAVEHPCPDIGPLVDAAKDVQNIYNSLSTSIIEPDKNIDFSLSPNPTRDILNIRLSNDQFIKLMELININGQTIYSWREVNQSDFQIIRKDWSAGMYFVKVITTDGKVGVQRIVFN